MSSSQVPHRNPFADAKTRLIVSLILLIGCISAALLLDGWRVVENRDKPINLSTDERVHVVGTSESSSTKQGETSRLATDLSEVPEVIRRLLDHPGEPPEMDLIRSFARSEQVAAPAPILLLLSAEELYAAGCYSDSLTTLEEAWVTTLARPLEHWTEHKLLARIGSRLGELYARLGRMEKLEQLLAEMKDRPIEGAETLAFTNLHHALND